MKKIMFNDKYGLTQAVLERRKTQTRRIITPQPTYKDNCGICWKGYAYGLNPIDFNEPFGSYMNFVTGTEYDKSCRRYRKGEVVAVAQSYCSIAEELENCKNATCAAHYEKNVQKASEYISWMEHPGFNNKMFVAADMMIHQIRITDVRVERLQDISDECCLKEGIIKKWHAPACKNYYYVPGIEVKSVKDVHDTPQEAFAHLINKVSRKDVWSENPYVFVYDFELVK